MADKEDEGMLSQSRFVIDLHLPHGNDTPTGGYDEENNDDTTEVLHYRQTSDEALLGNDDMEDVRHTAESRNGAELDDQRDCDQNMSYDPSAKDFHDDGDQETACNGTFQDHHASEVQPQSKTYSMDPGEGGSDEASLDPKMPRQSLFGGGPTEDEEQRFQEYLVGPDEEPGQLKTSREDMCYPSSSILDLQKDERSPSERSFHLGFGLHSSNRGSMSPRAPRATSEESIIIPPDDQPAYEFRQNIERKKAFTYIDTDKSGNFDPSEEAKQRMLKLNKAKAAKAAKATQQKKRKGKTRVPQENRLKCIAKLQFKAFGNVRNCTNDEDNWPDDWSEYDSDREREIQVYREFYRRNTPRRETQRPIEDPGGDVDDLTGYPAARGCRSCRKHEQDCSMARGGTYPCELCLDEGFECEPILPPTTKGRCKQCNEDGEEVCSFERDPEQAVCDHCADFEYICEALPPNGYKADRIDIYELIGGPHRQYAQCTACRSEKKRCSLKKKTDTPPCKNCKKNNLGCTFYDLPKPMNAAKSRGGRAAQGPTDGDAPKVAMPNSDYFTAEDLADMELEDEEVVSRETTPEVDMEDAEGHKGTLIKIQTSFAHPIKFNTIEQVSPDCNFCELPTYSFTGFYEKTVHVLKWSDGLGYSEIAAGHREDGNGATTMCQDCVIHRVQIICCSSHEMHQIYDADLDLDQAANDIMLAAPRSPEMRYQLQRWCSMCFSLATYKCCAQSEAVIDEAGGEVAHMEGCGFRLCAKCEMQLTREFNGDVGAMATAYDRTSKMEADTPEGTWVARADVGLLRKEGLLMANVERDALNEGE